MSGRKRTRPAKKAAKKAPAPVASAPPVSVRQVLDECVAGLSLIEVTVRSLDENDYASCEQVTLRRALKALWIVHDYLTELEPDTDEQDDEDES